MFETIETDGIELSEVCGRGGGQGRNKDKNFERF